MLRIRFPLLLAAALAAPAPAAAQTWPAPADVASPEAVVAATYEAINRAPGGPFQWDRFRSLFRPDAILLPAVEQTGGERRPLSVEQFIDWVDRSWQPVLGTPQDRGFAEEQVHAVVERFGDIAHVMSTYEKRFGDEDRVVGRGINSIQLVFDDGRWWISSIAWDEEVGAGPVPPRYMPGSPASPDDAAERDIGRALEDMRLAWNRNDLDAHLLPYAADATWMTASGLLRGRDAIRASLVRSFQRGTDLVGDLDFSDTEFHRLDDDAMMTTGAFRLTGLSEGREISGRSTLLWVREGGVWRIVHDHSS